MEALKKLLRDNEFTLLFSFVVITLGIGTYFYNMIEGWTLLDSFYFSVITLTTVGYGDLAPVTATGKLFTVVYLILGIGTLLGFINVVTKRAMRNGLPIDAIRKSSGKISNFIHHPITDVNDLMKD